MDLNLNGLSNAGASLYDNDCKGTGKSFDLLCSVPKSGHFYLNIDIYPFYGTEFNFTLTADITVCNVGSLVGYNCSFESYEILDPFQTYNVKLNYSAGYKSYPFRYFYFDAQNLLKNNNLVLNIDFENITGYDEGVVIFRKHNFPDYDSIRVAAQQINIGYNNYRSSWLYTFYDTLGETRNWIGLGCYSQTCQFNLRFVIPSIDPISTVSITTQKLNQLESSNTKESRQNAIIGGLAGVVGGAVLIITAIVFAKLWNSRKKNSASFYELRNIEMNDDLDDEKFS